jgi:starch synthase
MKMKKITLSCLGTFHHFDLAEQLQRRNLLGEIYTSYPRFKLTKYCIAGERVKTNPLIHAPYMGLGRFKYAPQALVAAIGDASRRYHDLWVSACIEESDFFVGLSGHNLKSGRRSRELGAMWICDRGSSHILNQVSVVSSEYKKWGAEWRPPFKANVAQELAEYAESDVISVPTQFAKNTFITNGVNPQKIKVIPYGVNLNRFSPVGSPDCNAFTVLFVGGVGFRKGIPYLIEAFRRLKHPWKKLVIIGSIIPDFKPWLTAVADSNISIIGHVNQLELKEYMSKSDVLVMPSVEEGLAMVQAQAMACGCPVIGTYNAGTEEIVTDGVDGYVIPAADVDVLIERLNSLMDNPELRNSMRQAALNKVRSFGGWDSYANKFIDVLGC